MRQDLHTHTTFSYGQNTPEEMVLAALEMGLERIGFSDHSPTFFDQSYCMKDEDAYKECISALKEKYKGRIDILCGIEQDYYSDASTEDYDYVIGSVHYLKLGEEYVPVDETPALLVRAAEQYFDADIYALAERYFETVEKVVKRTGCDIIGHIDLIAKFQGQTPLFDIGHPRYMAAWRRAADACLATGKCFEINTSPLYRGALTHPYPAPPILDYLYKNGAKFILSGDCHNTKMLGFAFDKYQKYIK